MLYPPSFETHTAIIDTVNGLFLYTDLRSWEDLKACLADSVMLDYTSMNGGDPVALSPQQLVDAWSAFLPGFQATHHQVGNHRVRMTQDEAAVFCYGTATHYLPNESGNNSWTVVGTYDFRLVFTGASWRISRITFYFKFQDGNLQLPTLARQAAQPSI